MEPSDSGLHRADGRLEECDPISAGRLGPYLVVERHCPDDELPAMQLLDELYGDPDVLAVLARHDVPLRPEAGTIAERFPEPALEEHRNEKSR